MLTQSSSKMKKVLAILLAVLFVVSLTAMAASAHHGSLGWGGFGAWGGYGCGLPGPVWGLPNSAPAYGPVATTTFAPISSPASESVCEPRISINF
jgi:flagellar basal body-associated protein FliL